MTIAAAPPAARAISFESYSALESAACPIEACSDSQIPLSRRAHPCSSSEGRALRRASTCPGTRQWIVNPFALMRQGASASDRCRNALLLLADRQARAAIARIGASPDPAQEDRLSVIHLALAFTSGACVTSFGLAYAAQIVDLSEVSAVEERAYCYDIVPRGCDGVGGQFEIIAAPPGLPESSEVRCTLGGIVLDQSCLDRPPVDLGMLRDSVQALGTTGGACLSGTREFERPLNLTTGEALRLHLASEVPRTQICCGDDCQTPIPWMARPAGLSGAGATSRTEEMRLDGVGSGMTGGTVQLTENAFVDATYQKAILFHEMLHQIGMCRSADHDSYLGLTSEDFQPVMPQFGGVSCPGGYRFTRDRSVCERANQCGGALPVPSDGYIERFLFAATWDPIYACQMACYYPSTLTSPDYAHIPNRDRIRGNCGAPNVVRPANSAIIVGDQNLLTGCAE